MGARGPLPKDDAKRSRRGAPNHETVELGGAPASGAAPKITRAEWRKLHTRTREWWNSWLKAPQASQFIVTDWTRLRVVMLPLVEGFNRAIDAGDTKLAKDLAGELRQQEADFGATPAARRRAGWTIRQSGDNAANEPDDGKTKPRASEVHADPRRLAVVK